MSPCHAWAGLALSLLAAGAAPAQTTAPAPEPVGRKLIEIYRVAPGQHEAFLRAIAKFDEANVRGGVPPRQLYVHSDGASWDFLLIQDAEYPEGKGEAVGKAYREMGLPGGPRFFTEFRAFLLEHTDTFANGPTTAAAYLAELDARPPSAGLGAPQNPRYELRHAVPLGGTPRWDYVQVDAAARRVYVAHDTAIDVLDLDSHQVVGHVTGLAGAHGIALAPEFGRGFVASGDNDTAVAFSLATLEVLGRSRVGKDPDSIAYEGVSRRVVTLDSAGASATLLAAESLAPVATVPLGGTPEFAVADGRGGVFVNIAQTAEVVRLDMAAARVAARFTLPGCTEPTALAFDPAHRRLYSACGNGVLVGLDAETGRVIGRATIPGGADTALWDARAARLLVSTSDGTVTVLGVDAAGAPAVRTSLPTRATGRTMALDPVTGALLVPAVDLEWNWSKRSATFAAGGLKLYVFEPAGR